MLERLVTIVCWMRVFILFTLIIISELVFIQKINAQVGNDEFFMELSGFTLDGRNYSNSLEQMDGLFDGFRVGLGYEIPLIKTWTLAFGTDFMLSFFEDEYYQEYIKLAKMRIDLNAFAFNLVPRYYYVFEDESALFLSLITKLESSTSKARFHFKDKKNLSTRREKSAFQFEYGWGFGYKFLLNENTPTSLSLNFVSRDFGGSINKLGLEQSGYFRNERVLRSTSCEFVITTCFSNIFKRKDK